jgi:oligoribonuclease (3'-5' exoribonuclease)
MYVSIDIETTGLDPKTCQVLEVAMVALPAGETDPELVCEFPYFHRLLRYDTLNGSVVALNMNARIIDTLSEVAKGAKSVIPMIWPKDLGPCVTNWLNELGLTESRSLHPLGQNVGSFDMKFLSRLENFPSYRFHYRSLEVGSMYATRDLCPSLSNIPLGFTIPGEPHEALFDARYALACAMTKWRNDELLMAHRPARWGLPDPWINP